MSFLLERKFSISGAYNDPSGRYGCSSMKMEFAVIGPKGAVSVLLFTAWFLPENQQKFLDLYTKGYPFDPCQELMAPKWWDVGHHSNEPMSDYEKEHGPTRECCHLTGKPCYYDGTSLWGQEAWLPGFLHGGTEWLWPRLEELYSYRFENGPEPNLTPVPRIEIL